MMWSTLGKLIFVLFVLALAMILLGLFMGKSFNLVASIKGIFGLG
jgi:hypothetical protein